MNGDGRHPLYGELTKTADADGHTGDIRWNFEKFLIAPDGAITRFSPMVAPEDETLVAAIEASKAQPLSRLLFGLGIKDIGETVARQIAQPGGKAAQAIEPARARLAGADRGSRGGSERHHRSVAVDGDFDLGHRTELVVRDSWFVTWD